MIADHFSISHIGLDTNIGIGKAFIELTGMAKHDNVLILEHDWQLIEEVSTTYNRLKEGIELLDGGYNCIRYRHRIQPGFPHFSFKHMGNELNYYDEEIQCTSPHLLDSIHWLDPATRVPDKIQKEGEYFVTTSPDDINTPLCIRLSIDNKAEGDTTLQTIQVLHLLILLNLQLMAMPIHGLAGFQLVPIKLNVLL
jgi:hypothetical protein